MFSIVMKRSRDALLVLALGLFGVASAEGPVQISGLPGGGGNVVSDTDVTEGGSLGQRWGRAGGRTITYHVANPSTFSALTFGVVQGTAPSLAFDNAVNSPGEVMTFTSGQSNLGQGMARWTGFANLPLFNGGVSNLPTRFTITVTRTNGTPVALGGDTLANVLATGDFRVNLLFEMQDLNNPSIFRPVLDYYDSLPTPTGPPPGPNVGPVLTGVNTGFYYTLADTGMTVEEHDAHVQALFDALNPKINNINDKVNFLRTDWDGRIPAIQSQVGTMFNTLNNNVTPTLSQIQSQLSQLLGQSGGTGNLATRDDVNNAKNQLSGMLMVMLGFVPCPVADAGVEFCTNFGNLKKLGGDTTQILIGLNNANTKLDGAATKLNSLATQSSVDGILIGLNSAIQGAVGGLASQASVNALDAKLSAKIDEVQDALDNMSSQSLDVRAVQVDSGDPKKLRWIVKTTRDGALVNATLSRFATVRGYSGMANVMGSAVVTSLGTGMHDVVLNVSKEEPEGVAYLFEARLIIGPSDIVGSALVVTEKKGASPF